MDNIYIWWMDKCHLMGTGVVLDAAEAGDVFTPVLPGHIRLALSQITPAMAVGKVIAPVTMSYLDTDIIESCNPRSNMTVLLKQGYVGIFFEEVHLATLRQYPGILTTYDLDVVPPAKA